MNTPITEKCLERHSEDENDNLKLDINTKGTQNSIPLNYDHRPQRGAQKTKLGFVRQLAHKIKESVIGNIIENVIEGYNVKRIHLWNMHLPLISDVPLAWKIESF